MHRLLFRKTGRSVWISHLDLMRLFQRAFKRAGLSLTHTQGFNPRPSVSIALPLSVGVESDCELLDFELEGESPSNDEICKRLNDCLVAGVEVIEVYSEGRKIRDLSLLRCSLDLEYDAGVSVGCVDALNTLLSRASLFVPKKTKNGLQDQDIIPMIREISIVQVNESKVQICALVCCQNPTLNPMQIPAAISIYTPQYAPDHCYCKRLEIYDKDQEKFR